MIEKEILQSFLQKYHLGGIVDAVKITSDQTLTTEFICPTKDLVGKVHLNTTPLGKCDLFIYDTSRLLKMISVTSGSLMITTEGNKVPTKIFVSDNKYEISYPLATPSLIQKVPTINEPTYQMEFEVNEELRNRIHKSTSAVGDSEIVWVGSYDDIMEKKVQMVFGENTNHSNKISIYHPFINLETDVSLLPFSSTYIKEIMNANKGINGTIYVSREGIMKLVFNGDGFVSTYFIIRKNIQ